MKIEESKKHKLEWVDFSKIEKLNILKSEQPKMNQKMDQKLGEDSWENDHSILTRTKL